MSKPLSRVTTRIAYGASQLPRIAWYVGHSLAVRRLSEAVQQRTGSKERPRAHTNLPVPDRRRLYADMAMLLQKDLANIEAGLYPLPADHDGSLLTLLNRSRLFFIVGNAESLPVPDKSQDAVTSIFLFHELPPMDTCTATSPKVTSKPSCTLIDTALALDERGKRLLQALELRSVP